MGKLFGEYIRTRRETLLQGDPRFSIRKVADRVLMLDDGRVVFNGTLEEVEAADNERVRQFFERRADEFIAQRNFG